MKYGNSHKLWQICFAALAFIALAPLLSVNAEAEPAREVLYVEDYSGDAEIIQKNNKRRTDNIVKNYISQMKTCEKLDNDIRYLIDKSSTLEGEQLAGFISKYILPKNRELCNSAAKITSQSSALRGLHAYYMDYIAIRTKMLHAIIGLSREKIPASYTREVMAASYSSKSAGVFYGESVFGSAGAAAASSSSGSSYYEYVHKEDEHVPLGIKTKIAGIQSLMDEMFKARNAYLNCRDYIMRNSETIIIDDK